ncbi:MAG: response regulator [Thermodesulfobacteriota bacterium]
MIEKPTYEDLVKRVQELEQAERQRSAAMDRLAQFNQLMTGMLEHTHIMTVFLDPGFNFIWVNRAYADTCKQEPAFFPGKNHFDLYPHEENKAIFQRVVDTGEPFFVAAKPFEFPDQPERGVTYWDWSLVPVKNADNTVSGLVFTLTEVTERIRMEEMLIEGKETYRTVADFTYDWEYWVAPDGSLPYVSPACERLTGYRPEEFQQTPGLLSRIVHPDDESGIIDHISGACRMPDDQLCRLDFRLLTRAGEERWISHACRPVFSHSGQYRGRRVSNRDVTDRKQTEKALQQAHDELENRVADRTEELRKEIAERERITREKKEVQRQKVESLGRMAGAVAHHFNNQLAVVIGNLELTLEKLPRDEAAAANLNSAFRAARKAAEVSGLMLTYLGQTAARKGPMDISETCRLSLPLLQAARTGGIAITIDFPTPGPTINGNANQIQQILKNLTINALESLKEDRGTIALGIRRFSAPDIPTLNRFPMDWQPRRTDYACLEVADTGCGIPEKEIGTLFDPFFTNISTDQGLGLPVVLGIVRAHDGAITVESAPGRGSIFRVFFPVSAEEISRPARKGSGFQPLEGTATILLVEDTATVRKMVAMMLRSLNITVLEAEDGIEALTIFRQHHTQIHCVLCDVIMPRMNGWETLAALRTISPGLPVILSSGYDEGQVMEEYHAHRPTLFIRKPFSKKELETAVQTALACRPAGP